MDYFYYLEFKVTPYKDFTTDLNKIAMGESYLNWPPPRFEYMVVLNHKVTWSPNFFFGFGIVLIQLSLLKVIFHLKFEIYPKIRKSLLFPLNKAKIEKWPIWANLTALWNLGVWDPYTSFEPTFITFWDYCFEHIIWVAASKSSSIQNVSTRKPRSMFPEMITFLV